jgi:hypothetical protein
MKDRGEHIAWLRHDDLRAYLESDEIPSPWFPLLDAKTSEEEEHRFFAALIPVDAIPTLLKSNNWDLAPRDGGPVIWQGWRNGEQIEGYDTFGTDNGVEPLVVWRQFHGIRPDFIELCQEFRLFHNLYPDPARCRFLKIDDEGNESEAVRYDDSSMTVRTELLREFCAIKQMALGVYVESFRFSTFTLEELGLERMSVDLVGERHAFPLTVVAEHPHIRRRKDFETRAQIIGGKKYVLPRDKPLFSESKVEQYQEFITGTDPQGNPIRHTCDPGELDNAFGQSSGSPHYLTPVFFRADVLDKYYAKPDKYEISDGRLSCGGLWGMALDNDHEEFVVVFLGDLGRDLSETERNHWLAANIPPDGRTLSNTKYTRAIRGWFADPERPDHLFKMEFGEFSRRFREAFGWDFFLPLHDDDQHFFTSLRLPASDNQSEFDGQLLALTKVLIDSLNEECLEREISLDKDDKGITKLKKFFVARGITGHEPHIKLLRVLWDLRSKGAAHRKGSNYDKLVSKLGIPNEGQQKVLASILRGAVEFIRFLRSSLLPDSRESDINGDQGEASEVL